MVTLLSSHLLWFAFSVIETAESIGLRNTAVISGSTASFSCVIHAPPSQVCWSRETVLPEKYNTLYAQGKLEPACGNNKCDVTFDNETDRYTLTINSVQHYDAGFYECGECLGDVEQAAQLIVLQTTDGSEGKCTNLLSEPYL